MKNIPLSRRLHTLVDDETFEDFGHLKWHATSATRKGVYAARSTRFSDGTESRIHLHRIVALARAGEDVHHVNGNTLDNRRENLVAMPHGSHQSLHVRAAGPFTGKYRGVYYFKPAKKWAARITFGNRAVSLGYHATPEEAALAWDKAASEAWGPSVFQNFPTT